VEAWITKRFDTPKARTIRAFFHFERAGPEADLQKVGCASRPMRSAGHEPAHMGRYRVGVDDVLDRVAPVIVISSFKGARGSKCALAGCGPEREISHARQPLEAYMRQHA
jgi:hypothetical protein